MGTKEKVIREDFLRKKTKPKVMMKSRTMVGRSETQMTLLKNMGSPRLTFLLLRMGKILEKPEAGSGEMAP